MGLIPLLMLGLVVADFGDYADPSFQCPALTTCPVVCVSDLTLCPFSMADCPAGTALCPDGSCGTLNGNNDDPCANRRSNPCESNRCGNVVACPKTVDTYDECLINFEEAYFDAHDCIAHVQGDPKIPWTAPGFVLFAFWILIMTAVLLGWCAYNQRLFPVGKPLPMDDFSKTTENQHQHHPSHKNNKNNKSEVALASETDEDEDHENENDDGAYSSLEKDLDKQAAVNMHSWTQTAYRQTRLGMSLYTFVLVTLFGFHVILAVLVAFFYAQENNRHVINPFYSEQQVLAAFEIVWTITFVWSFALKWPHSMWELFLRRSDFQTATHIAVFAPTLANMHDLEHMPKYVKKISVYMDALYRVMDDVLGWLFSVVGRPKVRGNYTFCPIETDDLGTRYIMYRLRRYNYDPQKDCFIPGRLELPQTVGDWIAARSGLADDTVWKRRAVVGRNRLPMSKPSLVWIVINEFNKSFYLWQCMAAWVWMPYFYWHMGIVFSMVFISGGLVTSWVQYRNEAGLAKLSRTEGELKVLRNGQLITVPQDEAVPGDVVQLTAGVTFCDMVILEGDSILVDESALTGEATPVAKCPLDPASAESVYEPTRQHKKCTISAGTTLLKTVSTSQSWAVVTQCGSFTSRGKLLRDILFYERHKFQFDTEVEIVMLILILYAILCFGLIIHMLGRQPVYAWFYGWYIVAVCVPPLLPTTFVASVGISSDRLYKKRVATADPKGILVAGEVRMAFWDKTGTLTNQGMEFMVDADRGLPKLVRDGMSLTHTLTKAGPGQFIGHFIDVTMFEASGADFDHMEGGAIRVQTVDGHSWTLCKRFEFDHHCMMQSVITRDEATQEYKVFVKGSPESIKRACVEGVPSDFDDRTRTAAKQGVYQICLASKTIQVEGSLDSIRRETVESNLKFVDFLSFRNTLKDEAPNVIRQLKEGDVTSVMVTGDNVFTGIHIARECVIIEPTSRVVLGLNGGEDALVRWVDSETDEPAELPSFEELESQSIAVAMTGSAWSNLAAHDKTTLDAIAPYIRVVGRCTPNDKVSVLDHFVNEGEVVLMCGDGGNDCGALKTAHVGVALSRAEASIVSPFTSLDLEIIAVLEILREGRCSLANAFAAYKYMVLYGQIEVFLQFILGYFNVALGEWAWVFFDGFWLMTLAFSLPLSQAAEKLAPERPTSALLGAHTMSSAVGILAINMFYTIMALLLLGRQDWYQCRKWDGTDMSHILEIGDNYECSVSFIMCGWQLPTSALAFSLGFAHRAPWWKNKVFLFFFMLWAFLHLHITLIPSKASCLFRVNCENENVVPGVLGSELMPIQNPFHTTLLPVEFRVKLVCLMVMNLLSTVLWEWLFVNTLLKVLQSSVSRQKAMNTRVLARKSLDDAAGVRADPESALYV